MIETQPERREEFLELIGDVDQAMAELRAFGLSADRFERQEQELTRKYPDQWIAYKDGDVIAAGTDIDEVLMLVDTIGPNARNGIMLRFLTNNPMPMLL